MEFDAWLRKVADVLAANRSDVTTNDLDADAMYQAFSNGVSPEGFAKASVLPVKPKSPEGVPVTPPPAPPAVPPVNLPPVHRASPPPPQTPNRPVPPTPLPSATAYRPPTESGKGGKILVGIIVGLIVLVVGGVALSSGTGTSHPGKQIVQSQTEAPLTDAKRLELAKVAMSTWKGDDNVYSDKTALLESIPKTSPEAKEAKNLLAEWAKRKVVTDRQKAKDSKVEAQRIAQGLRKADANAQKQAKEENAKARQREKEEMSKFTGDGPAQVAVETVKLKHSAGNRVTNEGYTYIYLNVSVLNTGEDTVHANPLDFTLADSDGVTASVESETYGLDNQFEPVNLRPGQQSGGWLIFCLRKDSRYTLTRFGGFVGKDVTKVVIP